LYLKNPLWYKFFQLTWQWDPIGYCFIIRFVSAPFRSWLASFGHATISGIVTVLLPHGSSEHIKIFQWSLLSLRRAQDNTDDQDTLHTMGPTPTMLGPQLMLLFPLQSCLQCDFEIVAIVSSVLLDQADLPKQFSA